jgi:hypothetical protein
MNETAPRSAVRDISHSSLNLPIYKLHVVINITREYHDPRKQFCLGMFFRIEQDETYLGTVLLMEQHFMCVCVCVCVCVCGAGWEFFSSPPRPERLWGPPSLLSNGYRGALSLRVKQPGREADHSPLSSAEVKNA